MCMHDISGVADASAVCGNLEIANVFLHMSQRIHQ